MIDLILLSGFLITTGIQIFFVLFFYVRVAFYQDAIGDMDWEDAPPVTILICAHNEAKNLKKNLGRILNQTYRSFQVLVVNHNSSDDSEKILISLQNAFKHLDYVNFNNTNEKQVGKKFALAFGIEKAQHEVLLLTDADCAPKSSLWLQKMAKLIQGKTEIGLGFGPYEKQPGFLNKLIRFETNLTAIQYFSFALAGIPYMGVGRNLIYKKSLFFKATEFKNHYDLASGDDDLFVNEVADSSNTKIILDPDSHTFSPPKSTWQAWYRQKSRHLTTGRRYRFHHQLLLGLASASHILHYLFGILLLVQGFYLVALSFYALRLFLVLLIFRTIYKKMDDAILYKWIPLLDVIFVVYYLVFTPVVFFGKATKW